MLFALADSSGTHGEGPYSCKNGVAWEMGRPRTELSVSRALARIKLSDS